MQMNALDLHRTPSRRAFLRSAAGVAAVVATLKDDWLDRLAAAEPQVAGMAPEEAAKGESFWFQVQQAFDIDRSLINLNNGGVAPSPRSVMAAMQRQELFANHAPSRNLWTVQDPQVELVRVELARAFGCDPEEMAITRNSSEALEIAINGIDLKPGDAFLTTTQDYPRMLTTITQRVRRERLVLNQIKLPIPVASADAVVDLFEKAITPQTRVILLCHIVNITGEIMPVKRIVQMARKRGIQTIVDGAHAFAHFQYQWKDLDCDYYGVSLHKWLTAPIGTGFLFVRRDKIKGLWPLMAAPEKLDDDIRKFEEIGTHPTAPRLAIAEALAFYHGIGAARKEARLRYMRDRWAKRLMQHDRVRIHTNLDPAHSCGIATVEIEGVDCEKLTLHLWEKHKIIVTPILHDEFKGIRVTPNVYTLTQEIDLFCEAMESVIKNGLPAEKK